MRRDERYWPLGRFILATVQSVAICLLVVSFLLGCWYAAGGADWLLVGSTIILWIALAWETRHD